MRLSVIGVIVMALFSALFVRLWFLQVAEGGELSEAATGNRERIVYEPTTRGRILDAQGRPLVDNIIVPTLTFDRQADLSQREHRDVVRRVAQLTQTPTDEIEARIDDLTFSPYEPVPIAEEVAIATIQYVEEHPEEFPGVEVAQLAERTYPNQRLASHVLGYVAEISPEELELHADEGYREGDLIGKSGVEQMFESELRGEPEVVRLEVDNTGQVEGRTVIDEGTPGNDVQLTLDLDIQRIAEESLAQGRAGAQGIQDVSNDTTYTEFQANGGTVVVLDARDGSVVAMASGPDFDPADVADGLTEDEAAALQDEESNFLLNRAIGGQYAPGSTWKPFSAVAGLETGTNPAEPIYDEGCIDIADLELCNAGDEPKGSVNMPRSLSVSSDVYYYDLGRDMWHYYCLWATDCELDPQEVEQDRDEDRAIGYAIQDTARTYGFGEPTGLGLSGEPGGRIPDKEWKAEFNESNPDETTRIWLPGDSANLAIGQGDLLVTPIQLAVGYTAIANGGTIFTPRLASAIREPATGEADNGDVIRELPPQPVGKTKLSDTERQVIIDGLIGATSDADGTAQASFSGYEPGSVCGKTGTSEAPPKQDTSLFVGILECRAESQYVALSIVEQGGFGADVAAPIVRRVMDALRGELAPPDVVVNPGVDDEED